MWLDNSRPARRASPGCPPPAGLSHPWSELGRAGSHLYHRHRGPSRASQHVRWSQGTPTSLQVQPPSSRSRRGRRRHHQPLPRQPLHVRRGRHPASPRTSASLQERRRAATCPHQSPPPHAHSPSRQLARPVLQQSLRRQHHAPWHQDPVHGPRRVCKPASLQVHREREAARRVASHLRHGRCHPNREPPALSRARPQLQQRQEHRAPWDHQHPAHRPPLCQSASQQVPVQREGACRAASHQRHRRRPPSHQRPGLSRARPSLRQHRVLRQLHRPRKPAGLRREVYRAASHLPRDQAHPSRQRQGRCRARLQLQRLPHHGPCERRSIRRRQASSRPQLHCLPAHCRGHPGPAAHQVAPLHLCPGKQLEALLPWLAGQRRSSSRGRCLQPRNPHPQRRL